MALEYFLSDYDDGRVSGAQPDAVNRGTYRLEGMWGWSDTRSVGDMFTVEATSNEGETERDTLSRLFIAYVAGCDERGWTPRDAYVVEAIEQTGDRTFDVHCGT